MTGNFKIDVSDLLVKSLLADSSVQLLLVNLIQAVTTSPGAVFLGRL